MMSLFNSSLKNIYYLLVFRLLDLFANFTNKNSNRNKAHLISIDFDCIN